MKAKTRIVCGVTAVTCLGLLAISVGVQADEIRGQGTVVYSGDPELDPSDALNPWRDHVSINAWIDDNGDAQGRIIWTGALDPKTYRGSFAGYPWYIDVDSLVVVGNEAEVGGFVVYSPQHPEDVGIYVSFHVVDNGNSPSDPPDEISGLPLQTVNGGNFVVK